MPDDQGLFLSFVEAVPEGQEESYLVQLGKRLWQNKRVGIIGNSQVGVSGLGGIGKSSLALRYAYLAKNNKLYDVIHWINAETDLSIKESYKGLLKVLDLPFRDLNDDGVRQTLNTALQNKTFLLIYDNVPVLYDKRRSDDVLATFFLHGGTGHFLMTSRRASDRWDNFALGVWRSEESMAYLIERIGLQETSNLRQVIGEIAEEMGHLPLALEHAGSYLRQIAGLKGQDVEEYLATFRKRRGDLFGFEGVEGSPVDAEEWGEEFDESQKTVATTWQMTLDKTPAVCHDVMAYCSYLNSDKIPVALLNPENTQNLRRAIDMLSRYSMVSKNSNEFISVHRLVQWVIRQKNIGTQAIFFDKALPKRVLSYVERSFSPAFSDEKIRERSLNLVPHIFSLIENAESVGYPYPTDHSLFTIWHIMSIETLMFSNLEGKERETIYTCEIKKMIPGLFGYNYRKFELGDLENLFKESHSVIKFSIGGAFNILQEYEQSLKWFQKAAEQGLAEAQHQLGWTYANAEGVKQDYEQAAKWYKKAAEQGYARAQSNLGFAYDQGKGVDQNDEEAVKWYKKAADQGLAAAQFNLGNAYDQGNCVTQDHKQAVKWWIKAAEQGFAQAQVNLGCVYDTGEDVEQNDEEAVKWWTKAADQGLAEAQYDLGVAYAQGRGVAQDYEKAVQWLGKAADQGNSGAQFTLGVVYAHGKGVAQNYEEAAKWYKKAAEQGNAKAQHNLGVTYDQGTGVVQNYEEAAKWYKKAAEQRLAEAQYNLGLYYEQGKGVAQNDEEAVKWFQKAADQGYAWGQNNLGWMYSQGRGVEQNYGLAAAWYRKAADQGEGEAQSNLGWIYATGTGLLQDKVKAFQWYEKAAKQGFIVAQYVLGKMYANGISTQKNNIEAQKWFDRVKQADPKDIKSQGYLGNGLCKDYLGEGTEWLP